MHIIPNEHTEASKLNHIMEWLNTMNQIAT